VDILSSEPTRCAVAVLVLSIIRKLAVRKAWFVGSNNGRLLMLAC